MVQVRNTDPEFFWLTSYLETALLRAIWYPTTVASLSYDVKKTIKEFLDKSSDIPEQLLFKLHDFGGRGASSSETASIGGMAHLVNFRGSDTMEALVAAREYYGSNMAGFSIPAAEHSTITSWMKKGEKYAYANMLEKFPGMVAIVSDSYDIYNAVDNIWGKDLKDKVLSHEGPIIIRPDSGDPATVCCKILESLWKNFEGTVNSKGYRVLNDKVRIIQGDGCNPESIRQILMEVVDGLKFAADNIAFGMGAGLLQKVDRDTERFAMKCNAVNIGGYWDDVYKDPKTDPGKKSKAGLLAVMRHNKETVRLENCSVGSNLLRPVFENGKLLVNDDFETIRARTE